MGLTSSNPLRHLFAKKEIRLTIAGLNAAGATTILYRLKLGEVVQTTITIGFNLETVEYKNISFSFWDIGAWNKSHLLWKYYLCNTHGLVYVVDSNNPETIDEAREQLLKLLSAEELQDSILLVFANKQDLPDAMSTSELTEKLGLQDIKDRLWHVQPASGISGEGLHEGLDWIIKHLKH
ncbi:hypothetical protein FO519_002962 [Halicephalobus sp. NKZ332]|nr:hypothetical protein FO519_002962 [Halicephalobus sp. NKZ332]